MFSDTTNNKGVEKNYGFKTWDKERLEEIINNYDKEMLTILSDLYASLTGERLDLNNIGNIVEMLMKYNAKTEYNYLNNLLYPEKCKNVKIPSPIPVPSCSFQLHNCVTLTPNSSGNIAILFNPNFLASNKFISRDTGAGSYYDQNGNMYGETIDDLQTGTVVYKPTIVTSLLVNNASSLNGTDANDNFKPININQFIPDVYDQYRLVSASVVVKYIGRLDIVSGVIGGAIIFDEHPVLNMKGYAAMADGNQSISSLTHATDSNTSDYAKYGNFDLAMDSFYHQENMCLEGLRQLYFPLDNSYEEYTKLIGPNSVSQLSYYNYTNDQIKIELDPDSYRSGFNFFIYTLGAPNTPCLKLDIYCNFECLPSASFLNYMPTSVSTYGINSKEKKETLEIVQSKPIMKANEVLQVETPATLGFKGYMKAMARKFKNALPSMSKLMGIGINYLVPKLKPAISLVGTMINSMTQNAIKDDNSMTVETETPK